MEAGGCGETAKESSGMKVTIDLNQHKDPDQLSRIILTGVTAIKQYPTYLYFNQPKAEIRALVKIRRTAVDRMVVEMEEEKETVQ